MLFLHNMQKLIKKAMQEYLALMIIFPLKQNKAIMTLDVYQADQEQLYQLIAGNDEAV